MIEEQLGWSVGGIKMALVIIMSTLLMFYRQASSQSDYGALSIDCGAETFLTDSNNVTWFPDSYLYVTAGYHHEINGSSQPSSPMNTLRVFPDRIKNCYTFPAFIQQKYLLRAGFYYGNYDGRSQPPTFDLQFDANSWATVVTSLDEPVLHEAVVVAKRHNVSVCVARRLDGGVPFMSSLQIMQLLPGMYNMMGSDRALFKQHRVNFGTNLTVSYPNDKYGRIWDPAPPNGYTNVTADFQSLLSSVPDDPPSIAVKTAIAAASPSEQITLTFDMPQTGRGDMYVALYFTEVTKLKPGQNRTFSIDINSRYDDLSLSPVYRVCSEISTYADLGDGPLNVRLTSLKNSNLPPIISALELYSVSDPLVEGTSPEDVSGLGQLTRLSHVLAGYSGDPCLPVAWEWLRCNQDMPPRVTAIYLGNYGLQSNLRDFSEMQALEIIDLHNNSLEGHVPDFFGNFTNLKELNLANNEFWGVVPESLLNQKLSLNVSGNPDLVVPVMKKRKSNNTGLVIGLSIAGAFVLLCCITAMLVLRCSKREDKVATVELGRVPGQNESDRD